MNDKENYLALLSEVLKTMGILALYAIGTFIILMAIVWVLLCAAGWVIEKYDLLKEENK